MKLWLWKNGDHYLAFAHEYPTYGGGDPMVLGEPAGYAILVPSEPRRTAPPNVTGDPGSATPSQEDTQPVSGERWRPIDSAPQDGTVVWVYVASAHGLTAFQGSCAYHQDGGWCADELRPVTHWVPIECVYRPPPKDAGGPGSASNTDAAQERHLTPGEQSVMKRALRNSTAESSPTQTVAAEQLIEVCKEMGIGVAAPGPTAGGDKSEINRRVQARYAVLMHEGKHGHYETMFNIVHGERAAVRKELLAQIREPSEELIVAVAKIICLQCWSNLNAGEEEREKSIARSVMRALADKLTEAK